MSKRRREQSSAAPGAGVVRLNVGGTIYTTTLDTLRAVPDSLFGRMFDPDISLGMVPTDEDGNIFFDRDPEVFRWVLDFLRRRGRSVGMPRQELRPLLRDEADYFGLVGLVEACDADQAPEPIVAMLDKGFAGVITTLGTLKNTQKQSMDELTNRINDEDDTPLSFYLCGIHESMQAASNSLDDINTHIYNPHGTNDLYSAIRG